MAVDFPKLSVEEALGLPISLQKNGGNPMTAIDLATAIGKSPGSSYIRTLGSASSSYGLSGGSYKTTFTMGELGGALTAPTSEAERVSSLVEAALRPQLFKRVYDYYKAKKLPEKTYLVNTLIREFDVDAKQANNCADIFLSNMRFVGFVRQTSGGEWLANDAQAVPAAGGVAATEETPDPAARDDADDEVVVPPPPIDPAKRKRPNRLFVGHGRNKKPLDQLTKVLRDLGIPYLVAQDEANAGRPISAKVRETMEECGAAILVFSADVEYFDKDGQSVWRPSENVSHELGASSIMYEDRIILFKEEDVTLASNFSGIGYITFEKDKLDAKTNELLRELVALKILRMSVSDDE